MSHEEIRKFRQKANGFLDTAIYNYNQGRYDIAAFCIEQSVQLFIKTKLLETVGEFPRTHNIVLLMKELGAVFNKSKIEKFIQQHIGILTKLSDVYITSRYYTRDFFKEELDELLAFIETIKEMLEYD